MKKILIVSVLAISLHNVFGQQGVGINTTGASPNSKSMLDIDVAGKGLLIPRMTWTNRPSSLGSTENGLLIFSTDGDGTNGAGYYYWNGSSWENIVIATSSVAYIQSQSATTQTARFKIDGNGIFNGGNVGIGSGIPTKHLSLGGDIARTIGMERSQSSIGLDLTINAGGSKLGNADHNGGNLVLSSGTTTGTGTSAINFQTPTPSASGSSDNNPSIKMTILGNGNVGIGSTAPTQVLDVNGNAKITGNVSATNNITATNQLISSVATGTPPLVVSSTTQVPNLNAATAGTATNANNTAITLDNASAGPRYITWSDATSGNNPQKVSSSLSFAPSTGTLSSTNFSGNGSGLTNITATTNANLTGAVTSSGNATSLGSFTSANLTGALSDETGTGAAVFGTSPTLVTPNIGTPTSATLTNATGLPLTTGVTGILPLANGGTGANLSATGGAGQYLKQSTGGGVITVGTIAAADLPGTFSGFANPSATIGLTAVNGSASTAMRSDAAPALSQAITPTWTGLHTFSNATNSALFTGGNVGIGTTSPSSSLQIKNSSTSDALTLTATNSTVNLYLDPLDQGSNPHQSAIRAVDINWSAEIVFLNKAPGAGTNTLQERMRINTVGNVGIGSNAPVQKLDVSGGDINISSGNGVRINNGAGSGQYLRGDGTRFVSNGIQASDIPTGASGYIQNQNSADQAANFRTNGNGSVLGFIGIGTATQNGTSKLTIAGSNAITLDNGAGFYGLNSGGTSEFFFSPRGGDNVSYLNYGSAGMNIRNNAGTSTMFITSGNSLGIGTTNPGATLNVLHPTANTTPTKPTGNWAALIENNQDASDSRNGLSVVTRNGGNTSKVFEAASYWNGSSQAYTPILTVSGDRNVGIGITTPIAKLQVVASAGTSQFAARFTQTNTTNGYSTMIGLGTENSGWSKGAIGFLRTGSYDVGDIIFSLNSNAASGTDVSTADERMRLTSTGNLGIGTTNPGATLNVLHTNANTTPTKPSGNWAALIENNQDATDNRNGLSVATRWGGSTSKVFEAASYWNGSSQAYTPILTVTGDRNVTISSLAGTGNRTVYADAGGVLRAQSSAATSNGQGLYYTSSGTFVVPGGVYTITVTMWGAGGGSGYYCCSNNTGQGGTGSFLKGTINVTPGELLNIDVGGGGAVSTGGGGGGGTQVRRGGTVLAAAAGGGGGSYNSAGTIGRGGGSQAGSCINNTGNANGGSGSTGSGNGGCGGTVTTSGMASVTTNTNGYDGNTANSNTSGFAPPGTSDSFYTGTYGYNTNKGSGNYGGGGLAVISW